MNFADSEIVASILNNNGFTASTTYADADLVLINTCSIREKAEQTIRSRLHIFRQAKRSNPGLLIGVLGCMAERLKSKLLEEEKLVDLVVGPDGYRTLPVLIEAAEGGREIRKRAAEPGRNLCRHLSRAAQQQRCKCFRQHYAGLQ